MRSFAEYYECGTTLSTMDRHLDHIMKLLIDNTVVVDEFKLVTFVTNQDDWIGVDLYGSILYTCYFLWNHTFINVNIVMDKSDMLDITISSSTMSRRLKYHDYNKSIRRLF